MGTNTVDVELKAVVCGNEPSTVAWKVSAEQDESPEIDMTKNLSSTEFQGIKDSSTTFANLESEMLAVAPGFWNALPQTAGNMGRTALYNGFRELRQSIC